MGNFILIIVVIGSGSGHSSQQHIRFHTEVACKKTAEAVVAGAKQVNDRVGYYLACVEDAPTYNR